MTAFFELQGYVSLYLIKNDSNKYAIVQMRGKLLPVHILMTLHTLTQLPPA